MEYLKGHIDIIVDYGKMPFDSELILANFERIINMIFVVLFHVFSEFIISQGSFFIMMNSENTWKIYIVSIKIHTCTFIVHICIHAVQPLNIVLIGSGIYARTLFSLFLCPPPSPLFLSLSCIICSTLMYHPFTYIYL